MAPVFIFIKDVERVLQKGKKEIVIPKGARISAAALDLIKEMKIQTRYRSFQDEASVEALGEVSATPGEVSEISEEELEDIVSRVIERFRKGKASEPSEYEEKRPEPEDDDDLVICRCEEITKGEIKEAIRSGMRTLNGIKRITRAGMGLCQGQTCQRLVAQILATELSLSPVELEPTTARAPVRPVPLSVFATG